MLCLLGHSISQFYYIWICNPSAQKWIIFLPEFDIYENWMLKFQLSVNIITVVTFKSHNLNHLHIVDQLFSQMAMKFKFNPWVW